MKRQKLLALLITVITILSACSNETTPAPSGKQSNVQSAFELSRHASMTQDDFELQLFSDKTTYTTDEPIQIWATFKYFGEQDEIKIGHAMHYLGFSIIQLDGSLVFSGGMPLPYLTSVIKKNVEYRTDYAKSVGYSDDDPNVEIYKRFIEGDEVVLPAGTYKVSASAYFDLPDMEKDGETPDNNMPLEIVMKVSWKK